MTSVSNSLSGRGLSEGRHPEKGGRSFPVVLQTGFRPFFLLAAGFAGLVIPALVIALRWSLIVPSPLSLFAWHAHEMIFGFAGAVLAGFLLTAVPVWTGRGVCRPWGLAGLVLLWCLGRVSAAGLGPGPFAAVINVSFLLILAGVVARPIIQSGRYRNLPFPLLLTMMAGAQLSIWLSALGILSFEWVHRAEWVAIDALALTVAIIGGRIIPMFTRNRLSGFEPRPAGWVDRLALGSLVGLMAAHAVALEGRLLMGLLILAGGLQLLRLRGWGAIRALRGVPFVGVLHLGYALLGAGLLVESILPTVGRHLLSLGGVGLLCLAMMSRVTLGHTGRPLEPLRGTWLAVALLLGAVTLRTTWSLGLLEKLQPTLLLGAAILWSSAFVTFFAAYRRALLAVRVDGRPG